MATWWVNQGQTFEQEFRGGYMWAPKLTRDGRKIQAYEYMKDVRVNDIVYSFSKGQIRAQGIVTAAAVSKEKPTELDVDWNADGWEIRVDYTLTETPYRPKDDWAELRGRFPERYSPLDKNGDGSQGAYLSWISDELGAFLGDKIRLGLLSLPAEISSDADASFAEESEIWQDVSLEDTQRQALVNARLGQGTFKKRVYSFEKACRVTGVAEPRLLIASHIKPWRFADPNERLDGNNGLMLSPHIDKLFDRGLMTFTDQGEMRVNKSLDPQVLSAWSIDVSRNVGQFTKEQRRFLEYHRDMVFENQAW